LIAGDGVRPDPFLCDPFLCKKIHHEQSPVEIETHDMGLALVIDDEALIREVAGEMLDMCGFSIITAVNGLEGIEVFRQNQHRIALVLLDMTMPKMDGVACFYQLRKINPDVKVILVSGYSKKDIMAKFGRQKANGFLQKPFSLAALDSMVKKVL